MRKSFTKLLLFIYQLIINYTLCANIKGVGVSTELKIIIIHHQ
jgi:hypothetical protein